MRDFYTTENFLLSDLALFLGSSSLKWFMELTIFHNCQNVVSILKQCDIGQRIAINDDDVTQETFFNLAHFVSHERFTAVSRGSTKHFPGLEAHQVYKMLEVAAVSAHGDPSESHSRQKEGP